MKLAYDSKFLGTSLVVLAVLLVVVLTVNFFMGAGAATVAGAICGAIAVKLFDKLDFHPTDEIRFGAPLVSAPWIYAATASIWILYGSVNLVVDVTRAIWPLNDSAGPCMPATVLVGASFVGWFMFVAAGWVIGRLFPANAMGLASLAFVVLFLEFGLHQETHSAEHLNAVLRCFPTVTPENPINASDFQMGGIIGLLLQGTLCITAARRAAKAQLRASNG